MNKTIYYMTKGILRYDNDGKPICEICGRSFHRLGRHVYQAHDMTARQYKEHYGLDVSMGLISDESKAKIQQAVERNYEIVVERNLLEKGKETRFQEGHSMNYERSKQTLNRLRKLAEQRVKIE